MAGPAELMPFDRRVVGEYYASIADGYLALHTSSETPLVGGLYVQSRGAEIGLDSAVLPFGVDASIHEQTSSGVKFGVEAPQRRITIEGQTLTSISYASTEADAMHDLTVKLGLGRCGTHPATLPIGLENALDRIVCDADTSSTAFSEQGVLPQRYFASLVDGQLAFHGEIPLLAGIHVQSNTPSLSLGDDMLPFDPAASYGETNTPQEVRYGVAALSDRITLSGQTITAISYSGSAADAADDLEISLGLGQCGSYPAELPFGLENAVSRFSCNTVDPATSFTGFGGVSGNGKVGGDGLYATVVDGQVVLNGRFENLSAIHATSARWPLRLDSFSRAPFSDTVAVLGDNTYAISLGVLQPEDRVTIEGVTQTAIEYSQSSRAAEYDLKVDVRLEACGATVASVPIGIDNAVSQLACDGGTTEQNSTLPDFATVRNGAILIQGEFGRVRSIRADSRAGLLSLDSVDIDGNVALMTQPFNQANNVYVSVTPSHVELGVLNSDDRIDLEGETTTSILYAGAADTAAFDLSVVIEHQTLPDFPGGDGEGPNLELELVSVVDGRIILNGTFHDVVGIQALSHGGYLSLEESIDAPGISLTSPFPTSASVVNNTPNEIVVGVLGAANHINMSGQTPTSLFYSGPESAFLQDVTITLGVGNGEAIVLTSTPVVPEPTSGAMLIFGLLGLVVRTHRRKR